MPVNRDLPIEENLKLPVSEILDYLSNIKSVYANTAKADLEFGRALLNYKLQEMLLNSQGEQNQKILDSQSKRNQKVLIATWVIAIANIIVAIATMVMACNYHGGS